MTFCERHSRLHRDRGMNRMAHDTAATTSDGRWVPIAGAASEDFIDRLGPAIPIASRDDVRHAAVSILGKGIPPSAAAGQETGLVVGHVQSGKTMSFEMVAALAHDNAYQIIIVIAGTSTSLLDQSTGRLIRDLGIGGPGHPRRWMHLQNPSVGQATDIRNALDDWYDPGVPRDQARTVLITVLKHHKRLQDLATLLRHLRATADVAIESVPVLIVDDEADLASLNTKVAQNAESTTYVRLMELRQAVPHHTYLQYTATPQAPLLINIIDSLSPNFVHVLEPGGSYVGGEEFFGGDCRHVRIIPPEDVPSKDNLLAEPPASLVKALQVFIVGVAAGLATTGDIGNRSMLVHPSRLVADHSTFHEWVLAIIARWKSLLRLGDDDPDRLELVEEFRAAYDDLVSTVGLPADADIGRSLLRALRSTSVKEVNARKGTTPQVDWVNNYGWILVGGQAMDRGFTVEGLTVTYMPRGIGVGNADTLQQRARFFGYKRQYAGYCRIYLEQSVIDAFHSYVAHESYMHAQLKDIQNNHSALNEWKRAFILSRKLGPCRRQVVEFDYVRGAFADTWVSPRFVREFGPVLNSNRQIINTFVSRLKFVEDDGHPNRTDVQRHEVCRDISLRDAVEKFLVHLRITGARDSNDNIGMLLQLVHALEDDPAEHCTVYRMSRGSPRERRISGDGNVRQLFQGAAPVQPRERRGDVYPGDRAIHDGETVAVQIHMLNLTQDGSVVEENVPVVAVWIPARLRLSWLTQDQPAQAS